MRITPVPHGLEHLVGVSPPGRSPGLHMSTLYTRYHEGLSSKRYATDAESEKTKLLYFELGLTWEQWLEKALKERLAVSRPGELTTPEGIIYSPDLILFDDSRTILGEIKLTWMTSIDVPRVPSTEFPPKFDKYFTQMKAYCYQLETPYAKLLAFFVNGTGRPQKPEFLSWEIEFTKKELDHNWKALLNVARTEGML